MRFNHKNIYGTLILLFAGVAAAISLQGCSEDLDIREGIIEGYDENSITVNFVIPEAERIMTRANDDDNERKINNLVILVFNSNSSNATIQYREDVAPDDISKINSATSASNSFSYNINHKGTSSSYIYAIANAGDLLSDFTAGSGKTLGDLEDLKSGSFTDPSGGFRMSGAQTVAGASTPVSLVRSAAKITMLDENDEDSFKLKGVEFAIIKKEFSNNEYSNAALSASCFLTAGQNKSVVNDHSAKLQFTNNSGRFEAYSNPTYTHTTTGGNTEILSYMVIQGTYNDELCYYAIPPYNAETNEYFNILPNHWFDIRITNVSFKGYSTPQEAIENVVTNYVSYTIHDHVPEVYSMVSDGSRELGASNVVRMPGEKAITVKCFSVNTSETQNMIAPDLEIINGGDWLKVETPTDYTEDNSESRGRVFTFPLSTKREIYNNRTAEVKFTWENLSRTVTVIYDADFNMGDVCEAVLTIKGTDAALSSTTTTIQDYWTFVTGNGKATTASGASADQAATPVLYGIKKEVLANDKVRSEGFHFPMPYGFSSPSGELNYWTYEYELNFKEFLTSADATLKGTISGDSFITKNVKFEYDASNKKGKLFMDGGYSEYDSYAVGSLDLDITVNGVNYKMNVDIYHTGFFHYSGDGNYTSDSGYYYYEVVPLAGEGDSKYWLDRNIGAKSNKMYVNDGLSELGEPLACGNYLTVAEYQKYSDPKIVLDMCPPGYHIPVSSEWNAVRLSDNFVTGNEVSNSTAYHSTFFRSRVGKIYFPRAKYYNSSSKENQKYQTIANMGDASVGYYWTATAAPGMEKDEMGRWLRSLYLNGDASTYMNTEIEENKMLVRCVAGAKAPEQDNHYVSFNVHNVTHVYLFNTDTHSALYTFPGKAVSSAASSQQWQNFTCTTSVPLNKLGMLFLKVDTNGKVSMFTKDGKEDGDVFSTSIDKFNNVIENAINLGNYWDIQTGYYYDFCEQSKQSKTNNVTPNNPTIGAEGNYTNARCNAPEEEKFVDMESTGSEPEPGPNETVVWSGSFKPNWNDLRISASQWQQENINIGDGIRIYCKPTNPYADWWCVSYRKDWQDNFVGDVGFQFDKPDGWTQITVNESILNDLRNRGLMITGTGIDVTYVTIKKK